MTKESKSAVVLTKEDGSQQTFDSFVLIGHRKTGSLLSTEITISTSLSFVGLLANIEALATAIVEQAKTGQINFGSVIVCEGDVENGQ